MNKDSPIMTPPINSVSDERLDYLVTTTKNDRDRFLPDTLNWEWRNEELLALTELAARRAANTPVDGVSIKPLEWGDHDSLSIIAHTVLGPYLVEVINSPRVALWLPNMTGQARKMIEGFDSVEDAKAAAQADFNARIQACLTSPAAEPDYWAVWSATGTHIGTWPDKADAEKALQDYEWPIPKLKGSIKPLYTHPAPSASREVTEAVRDVLAERKRQIEDEGWTPEHDDAHINGEMARASGLYALIAGSDATTYRNAIGGYGLNDLAAAAMKLWPWSPEWFKPKDRRSDMVKSVALGIAEIERLDRAALLAALPGREG